MIDPFGRSRPRTMILTAFDSKMIMWLAIAGLRADEERAA